MTDPKTLEQLKAEMDAAEDARATAHDHHVRLAVTGSENRRSGKCGRRRGTRAQKYASVEFHHVFLPDCGPVNRGS